MEVNIVPQEYQDYLRRIGGENRYGEAMFKIEWAQNATFIAGGSWSVGEATFTGYRRLLSTSGEPCWAIFQWHDAAEYGSSAFFYIQNEDDAGLCTLGEYPYHGRHELLYNLRWHEVIDDKLTLRTIPLNHRTFDLIVPVIIAAKDVSLAKRKEAFEEQRRREEQDKLVDIERHLRDKVLPFTETVSYSKQGIRSSAIDAKMIVMQRAWGELQESARKFRMGMQTG